MPTVWVVVCLTVAGFIALALLIPPLTGLVVIREQEVGVVAKRFARLSLPPGRLIALNGEAGYQADTLAPGCHFGYWPWQYRVIKVPVTVVPQGEIALVVAADGAAIPARAHPGARRRVRQLPGRAQLPDRAAARRAASSASSPPARIASTPRCSPSSPPRRRRSTA